MLFMADVCNCRAACYSDRIGNGKLPVNKSGIGEPGESLRAE